jgi:hypothetical protein
MSANYQLFGYFDRIPWPASQSFQWHRLVCEDSSRGHQSFCRSR